MSKTTIPTTTKIEGHQEPQRRTLPLELIHKIIDHVDDRQTLLEASYVSHVTHEKANRQLWRSFAHITRFNLHLIAQEHSYYANLITDLTITDDQLFDDMQHPYIFLPHISILRLKNISRFPSQVLCNDSNNSNNQPKLTTIEMENCSIDFMPYNQKDKHTMASFFTDQLKVLRLKKHNILMDDDLMWIARCCRHLQVLDLTCSGTYITDEGLLSIAHANPHLEEIIVTLPTSVQSISLITLCTLEALQYYCKSMKRIIIKDQGFAKSRRGDNNSDDRQDGLKLWGFPCLEYYDFGYGSFIDRWSKDKIEEKKENH
ncbi:hypothetical protein BDA99DRAFT_585127 [Phascolomyces articulosus]|uniref:F-box domain-containing protein n=1 Tax=Phascolomyces articulosus TaxID=60185 RepID=A0AAD5JW70_9FUNG|nr:hypothetical protein BDA99DRAFT_585127 [Phascolomyces articulosus]